MEFDFNAFYLVYSKHRQSWIGEPESLKYAQPSADADGDRQALNKRSSSVKCKQKAL